MAFRIYIELLMSLVAMQTPAAKVPAGTRPYAYSLVVGSNRAGPGQQELRYAHADARHMAEVLSELGGYEPGRIKVLLDPDRKELLDALALYGKRLKEHSRRGEGSVFLFFYSGHARAHALNMGSEEIELGYLRERLLEMPATMTLAILDACQTGAISRIKGAEPVADFSYNSVDSLNTAGVAVMASSAASELSQESESLGASFFTHHLVVGLRGAADGDADGRITLSEAYRYAYNHTLVSTAATAVGKQHVTLETELRGKGEMVLTYPAESTCLLSLGANLKGEFLVHRSRGQSVIAELHKAAGEKVLLALAPGEYRAIWRTEEETVACPVELAAGRTTDLDTADCRLATAEEIGIKGTEPWRERWGLELSMGTLWGVSDEYTGRLEDFGFERQLLVFDEMFTFSVSAMYSFNPYLSLVLGFSTLTGARYEREVYDLEGEQRHQVFEWSAYGIGVFVRGTLPLLDATINPYLQVGGGLAIGSSVYRDPMQASEVVDDQIHWGYQLGVAGGLNIMIWDHFGIFGQANYSFAPVIGNELGEVHDAGGPSVLLGIRGAM